MIRPWLKSRTLWTVVAAFCMDAPNLVNTVVPILSPHLATTLGTLAKLLALVAILFARQTAVEVGKATGIPAAAPPPPNAPTVAQG